MTTRTLGPGDVARVAAKLDPLCADLDEDDQVTLHAIFAWAGEAVAAQEDPAEVGGFAFDAYVTPGPLAQSFAGGAGHQGTMEIFSFSFGATNPTTMGGSGGAGGSSAGKADLSPLSFTPSPPK